MERKLCPSKSQMLYMHMETLNTLELDECLSGENDCGQLCIDTVDSYKCGCKQGWELADDGKTCEGK